MEHAAPKQRAAQASLIDEIEAKASSITSLGWLLPWLRPIEAPDYVHVLRINPDKLEPVRGGCAGGTREGKGVVCPPRPSARTCVGRWPPCRPTQPRHLTTMPPPPMNERRTRTSCHES